MSGLELNPMTKALFSLLVAAAMLSSVSLFTVNTFAENAGCSRDCEAPTIGVLDDGQRVIENGLTLNGKQIDVTHQIQTVATTPMSTGGVVKAKLMVYENNGVSGIREVAFSIADYQDDRNRNEKVTIAFNQAFTGAQSVDVFDPENMIKEVSVKPTVIDQFRTTLDISFKIVKPFDTSAIIVETLDESRSSRTNVILNAIAATGKPIVEKTIEPVREVPAPLKQVKSGTTPEEVECREGLELVIRTANGAPACVYPFTADILRTWGMVN